MCCRHPGPLTGVRRYRWREGTGSLSGSSLPARPDEVQFLRLWRTVGTRYSFLVGVSDPGHCSEFTSDTLPVATGLSACGTDSTSRSKVSYMCPKYASLPV